MLKHIIDVTLGEWKYQYTMSGVVTLWIALERILNINFLKLGETRDNTHKYGSEKNKSLSRAVIFLLYVDVDECKKPDVCPYNYRCENLPVSYSCKCDGGYKQTGPRKKCKGNWN